MDQQKKEVINLVRDIFKVADNKNNQEIHHSPIYFQNAKFKEVLDFLLDRYFLLPFSLHYLFRNTSSQIIQKNKKFLVIANQKCVLLLEILLEPSPNTKYRDVNSSNVTYSFSGFTEPNSQSSNFGKINQPS